MPSVLLCVQRLGDVYRFTCVSVLGNMSFGSWSLCFITHRGSPSSVLLWRPNPHMQHVLGVDLPSEDKCSRKKSVTIFQALFSFFLSLIYDLLAVYAKPKSSRGSTEASLPETGPAAKPKRLLKYATYFSHLMYCLKNLCTLFGSWAKQARLNCNISWILVEWHHSVGAII